MKPCLSWRGFAQHAVFQDAESQHRSPLIESTIVLTVLHDPSYRTKKVALAVTITSFSIDCVSYDP